MKKQLKHWKRKLGNSLRFLSHLNTTLNSADQQVCELNTKLTEINNAILSLDTNLKPLKEKIIRNNLYHQIPSIFINTMPKSGSVYIFTTLARSLNIEIFPEFIAPGYFPHYSLMPNKLKHLQEGNRIRQEHFDASPTNIRILEKCNAKLVFHVRDPRQATLSWLHHVNLWMREMPDAERYSIHVPPKAYLNWSIEQQLDWHIETHFKSLVSWLRGWVNYLSQAKIDILLTSYEEMKQDEKAFFFKILEYYDIKKAFFKYDPPPLEKKVHFRKGEIAEWERVFTEKQKRRCDELLGNDLLERFSWKTAALEV